MHPNHSGIQIALGHWAHDTEDELLAYTAQSHNLSRMPFKSRLTSILCRLSTAIHTSSVIPPVLYLAKELTRLEYTVIKLGFGACSTCPVVRSIKPAIKRETRSNVRYSFPFTILLDPVIARSPFNSDDKTSLEEFRFIPASSNFFSIAKDKHYKEESQPLLFVPRVSASSGCVSGWSRLCQRIRTLLWFLLKFLIYWDVGFVEAQTSTVHTCQVACLASWSWTQLIPEKIFISTKTARTTWFLQLELSPLSLYNHLSYPSSQIFNKPSISFSHKHWLSQLWLIALSEVTSIIHSVGQSTHNLFSLRCWVCSTTETQIQRD